MRNKSIATLGLLALLATASAFGQRVKADIPFEFRVGDTVMPAGQYDVNLSFGGHNSVMSLRCYECRAWTSATTVKVGRYDSSEPGRLLFHKYGETYFLSEAWSPDSGVGSALRKSRTEREMARNTPKSEAGQVMLALR